MNNTIEMKIYGNMVNLITYDQTGTIIGSYITTRHLPKQDKRIHMVEAVRHLKYIMDDNNVDDICRDYNLNNIGVELLSILNSINQNL